MSSVSRGAESCDWEAEYACDMVVDIEPDDRLSLPSAWSSYGAGSWLILRRPSAQRMAWSGSCVRTGHQRLAVISAGPTSPLFPTHPCSRLRSSTLSVHAGVRLEDVRRHQSKTVGGVWFAVFFRNFLIEDITSYQDPPHRSSRNGLSAPVAAPARLGDGSWDSSRVWRSPSAGRAICSLLSSAADDLHLWLRACSSTWRSRPTT